MNGCLIVLVLYKQKLHETASYQSLMAAWPVGGAFKLLVYDNSPESQSVVYSGDNRLFQYIHDPSNPGVGKAYNVAGTVAREEGYDWLLLMDQDSSFPPRLFDAYTVSIRAFPNVHVFGPSLFDHRGLLSPFRKGRTSGKRLGQITPGLYSLNELAIINSGMLIKVSTFHQAKGYDERLPLDFSDIHFLSRVSGISPDFVVVDLVGRQAHSDQPLAGYEEALRRFGYYLRAARVMGGLEHARFSYLLRSLGRALKLTVRYRSLRFLQSALTTSV